MQCNAGCSPDQSADTLIHEDDFDCGRYNATSLPAAKPTIQVPGPSYLWNLDSTGFHNTCLSLIPTCSSNLIWVSALARIIGAWIRITSLENNKISQPEYICYVWKAVLAGKHVLTALVEVLKTPSSPAF